VEKRPTARWHTAARGRRIVYLSEHSALSLIEVVANLKGDPNIFPDAYQLMKVRVAPHLTVDSIEVSALPDGWQGNLAATRAHGDDWLNRRSATLLAVPSAVAPESWNFLLNPLHDDARQVSMEWAKWVEYDKRLFKIRHRP
jgi:RES domain-containing protein